MINVIICEDNEKDSIVTKRVVKNFMSRNNKEYELHLFNDYNKDFYSIVERNLPFKVYLLDIETPSRSGIDVAREIRRKDINSVIIFLPHMKN